MSTNHRPSKFAIPGISPCCGKGPHNHTKKADAPVAPKKGRPSYPRSGARRVGAARTAR